VAIDSTQAEVIQAIIGWAEARPAIRCVLLTSTRAIPGSPVDALSDFDLILVVDDIHPFVSNHSWLDDFGHVLVAYWDPIYHDQTYGMEVCANVVQYQHGLKIDFTLWPVGLLRRIAAEPQLPPELEAGYRVLVDKDHLTRAMLPPAGTAYIPRRPSREEFDRLVNDFLSDAPYVAKCLWREELLPAKWCLDYDMKHIYLRPVLEWLVETKHGWSLPVGNLGRGLKKYLPVGIWKALEGSYAGGVISDNWRALARTMELFHQVAQEVGHQLGYAYPVELHEGVGAYIERIRQLDKPGIDENKSVSQTSGRGS